MKSDRLLSILLTILEGSPCTATQLARRFKASVRTIYRDMETLSLAGIPIVSDSGPGGGYAIDRGYRLDKGFLTPDELSGLKALLESLGQESFDQSLASVLRKVRVLGSSGGPDAFIRYEWLMPGDPALEGGLLDTLRRAHGLGLTVSLSYRDGSGNVSQRSVEPRRVILSRSGLYLQAWCRLRRQFRLFKLCRIQGCALGSEPFDPSAPATPEEWLQPWDTETVKPVVLLVGKESLASAIDAFPHALVEPQADGGSLLRFDWPVGAYLASVILSLVSVRALEPPELRAQVRAYALRTLELNQEA